MSENILELKNLNKFELIMSFLYNKKVILLLK